MKNNKKKGFTLVELVVVIAVIAILAAVLIGTFSSVINKANESKAMQEARSDFETYLVELDYTKAADVAASTNDYVITKGDYFFAVKDGQFSATVYESASDAIAAAASGNDNAPTDANLKETKPTDAGNYFVKLADYTNFYMLTVVTTP